MSYLVTRFRRARSSFHWISQCRLVDKQDHEVLCEAESSAEDAGAKAQEEARFVQMTRALPCSVLLIHFDPVVAHLGPDAHAIVRRVDHI